MPLNAVVIGHPIAHSRSPLIHGHWLRTYGIDGSYSPHDVAPEELAAFINRLRAGVFVGGNVTIPHKEAVRSLCDRLDDAAARIGAVNTLVRTKAGLEGRNTDLYGFLANLDAAAPCWDAAESAIVLGAGGAARAIIAGLMDRQFSNIIVLNRTAEKARALAAEFGSPVRFDSLNAFSPFAATAGLVVNTTSIGMHGTTFDDLPLERLPKTAIVTDIVYTPLETPLLAEARRLGLQMVDGLGMLLHQAVPGFEAWFGVRPEVTQELRQIVERDLGLI